MSYRTIDPLVIIIIVIITITTTTTTSSTSTITTTHFFTQKRLQLMSTVKVLTTLVGRLSQSVGLEDGLGWGLIQFHFALYFLLFKQTVQTLIRCQNKIEISTRQLFCGVWSWSALFANIQNVPVQVLQKQHCDVTPTRIARSLITLVDDKNADKHIMEILAFVYYDPIINKRHKNGELDYRSIEALMSLHIMLVLL